VHLTQSELALLLEGLDWRPPARRPRPEQAA
jgi:transposase